MHSGIYCYYDTYNKYIAYVGKDIEIYRDKRHKSHLNPNNRNLQQINRVIQDNPNRYQYFRFIEGNYNNEELKDLEKEAISLFKTYAYDYPEKSVFNYTQGGDDNPSTNPNIANKISKSLKIYTKTKEHCQHISDACCARKQWQGKNNPKYHKGNLYTGQNNSFYGKKHKLTTRIDISQKRNKTGILNVSKEKRNNKQGFVWLYKKTYDNKLYQIRSVNLETLKNKVLNKNLDWIIIDDIKLKESLALNSQYHGD